MFTDTCVMFVAATFTLKARTSPALIVVVHPLSVVLTLLLAELITGGLLEVMLSPTTGCVPGAYCDSVHFQMSIVIEPD